jgi:hypothetical protein
MSLLSDRKSSVLIFSNSFYCIRLSLELSLKYNYFQMRYFLCWMFELLGETAVVYHCYKTLFLFLLIQHAFNSLNPFDAHQGATCFTYL